MMNAALIAAGLGESSGQSSPSNWVQQWLDVNQTWEAWWLLLGLAAQAVFFGRWIIQWIAAERQQASVMPILFWWCSLLGASMLMIYFIGRREPIGILGQAVGWLVYSRNLYLIKVKHAHPTQGSQPTPQTGPRES